MAESRATFTVRRVEAEEEEEGRSLEERLGELDGVMNATVDRESGEVRVRYDEELLAEERIREAARETGHELA